MECNTEVIDLAGNHLHCFFETKTTKEFIDNELVKCNFISN